MKVLKELIKGIETEIYGPTDIAIESIKYDSREVTPKSIFVCLQGTLTHGKKYINEAISRGASAIVCDELLHLPNVTLLVTKDTYRALGILSKNFFSNPTEKLLMVGITGTNGKTTVTYLLESIFNILGLKCGVIGTITYRLGDEIISAGMTTPQSVDLQYMLHKMVMKNIKVAVLEISSHALALGRTVGCEFDIAIFTNLTSEHLDYHKTMENYFHSKALLFEQLASYSGGKRYTKFAIINTDDQWGKKLCELLKVPIISYGVNSEATIKATNVHLSIPRILFTVITPAGDININSALLGKHNVYNILAAIACAYTQKIPLEVIKQGIENVTHIPGRLEKVVLDRCEFTVLVDFAHTPDALRNVLLTLRELNPQKIITIFGCGGDRDRLKRPAMGEIAVSLSDFVILTSDNPRSEEPEKILLDIESGIKSIGKYNYITIPDRKEAIKQALFMASKGDILLIAGKGHESYQIIGTDRIPFNDYEVVNELWREYFLKS